MQSRLGGRNPHALPEPDTSSLGSAAGMGLTPGRMDLPFVGGWVGGWGRGGLRGGLNH